jgi:DNA-directed RNA polymerase delta subunit
VRDRAYAVLARSGKPLHFREVASNISKSGWSEKRAHPQTVHNELIKDNRFVLVGRGLYALRDWGYEPGTVSDVIQVILKGSKRALSKEDIARRVLETRFVKPNTIFLNLQNKNLFKKTADGYTLA